MMPHPPGLAKPLRVTDPRSVRKASVMDCAGRAQRRQRFRAHEELNFIREPFVRAKAAVNAPQSKRCRVGRVLTDGAERLDCGGFSTAFERARINLQSGIFRAGESGVAFHFPSQSKIVTGTRTLA